MSNINDFVIEDGKLLKYNGNDNNVVIPDDGSVTSLGDDCFLGCESLESITIPESVTSLGDECFYYCTSLKSITIPKSVTSLGDGCFLGCVSLESISVAEGNTVYHSKDNCLIKTATGKMIASCKNSSIPVDGSVTSLGKDCFHGYSSLKSISIPMSVTSLGDGCLSWCASLESISVAEGNPIYHSKDNCLIKTATGKMIAGCKNSIIPDDGSVTSLGDYCFNGCKSLESITIPKSITSLGDSCFGCCLSLKSITIPESVTSLGKDCFHECVNLTIYAKEGSVAAKYAEENDFNLELI